MRTLVLLIAITFCFIESVQAESIGGPGGRWPSSWPVQLAPFREKAWTWEHGEAGQISYDIPFASREEFESAWPYILKVKSEEAPLTLIDGQHYYGKAGDVPASVVIFPPLKGHATGPLSMTRVYLKVDRKIVNLERILPINAMIVDKRSKKKASK